MAGALPLEQQLFIQEVSARDGFQIESRFVPTEQKIELVNAISASGITRIEVTSFTSPKAIPSLTDADEVMRGIRRAPGVTYAALVPNMRGCERALACGVDAMNVVMSASESHNRANLNMTCEQSLAQIATMVSHVSTQATVNVSLSTAFGCPFEGDVPEARLFDFMQRIVDLGIKDITLCDTTGVSNPRQVHRIFEIALTRWPGVAFTAHFHNTRGMGLTNVLAALRVGVIRFDASLGGLGGCPFAPGASGNVCTEDLVHMLDAMGYVTRIDLRALLEIAARLPAWVGHELPGCLLKAGPANRRYPLPPTQVPRDFQSH